MGDLYNLRNRIAQAPHCTEMAHNGKHTSKEHIQMTNFASPDVTNATPPLNFTLHKRIQLRKDVNGIAMDRDGSTVYLALGNGTLGGLAKMDVETEEIEVHQEGRPFRQVAVSPSHNVIATSQDQIHKYNMADLSSPQEKVVVQKHTNAWGIDVISDSQVIFSDPKHKIIHKLEFGKPYSIVAKKKKKANHLKSVWSVITSQGQVYVSDRKKRQIVCLELETGKYKWRQKIGRPIHKYQKLLEDMDRDYIAGMAKDSDGNVYVCDTVNDKLIKLTHQGDYTEYNDLGIQHPTLLAINSQYLVVISEQTILNCVMSVYRVVQTTSL